MTPFRSSLRLATMVFLTLLGSVQLIGQSFEINQNRIEAAMSLQLLSFTEWPETDDKEIIAIGILENESLFDEVTKLLGNDRYAGKYTVHLLEYDDSKRQLEEMDALFFSESEPKNIPRLIKGLEGKPVVLLGSFEGFLELGGMVNFVVRNKRFGFEISTKNASSQNIEFRAKLLRMATNIIEE